MVAIEAASAEIKMRLHTLVQSPHPYNDMAAFLAEEVCSRSDGAIQIQIFDAGQLGNDDSVIDEMALGTIGMMVSTTNMAANKIPEFQVFSMPYLFSDFEDLMASVGPGTVAEGYFQRIYAQRDVSMQLLALGGSGTRNLFSRQGPVNTLSDFSGSTMRTPEASPMVSRVWERLGTVPVPVSWEKVYAAAQTGAVDALECAIPGYAGSKLYEVAPYLALTAHTIQVNHISISNHVWERLTKLQQSMLVEVAREASILGIEKAKVYESDLVETLRSEHGVTVTRPDTAEFHDALEEVKVELLAELGLEAPMNALKGQSV